MKCIALSLFIVFLALKGRVLTYSQIAHLLVYGLVSLAIAWQLSDLLKQDFATTLHFAGEGRYAQLFVAAGYGFFAAALIAAVRHRTENTSAKAETVREERKNGPESDT